MSGHMGLGDAIKCNFVAREDRSESARENRSENWARWCRPKGVLEKVSALARMRQKCVRNASKMRQNGSCFLGKRSASEKGVFWKGGSFQKSPFSRDSREFRDFRDSRESLDCGKQRRIRPFKMRQNARNNFWGEHLWTIPLRDLGGNDR